MVSPAGPRRRGCGAAAGYLGFRRSTTTGEVGARRSSLVPRILGSLFDGAVRRDGTLDLPERFERMGAAEFEAEISCLLRALGYTVRPTPASSIHDIDLILEMAGRRVAVQLKRWKAPVGDRSVYGLFAGRIHHATHEAWLITTPSPPGPSGWPAPPVCGWWTAQSSQAGSRLRVTRRSSAGLEMTIAVVLAGCSGS